MVSEVRLAWLAGMFDGEGSITVFKHKERNGTTKLCPSLLVTNCDINIINECDKIFKELGTSFHLFERVNDKQSHKNSFQINTRNQQYMLTVLKAIEPYLIGKKAQAELSIRFLEKRVGKRTLYDEEDFTLQETIQGLNRRGKPPESSTTIDLTAMADDIV